MWSATILLAVLATMAFVHAAPKGVPSFRQIAGRSPKRESSSLVLGGRFGRSCFLQAGGCLGKRSMTLPQISFNEELPFDNQDSNAVPLERLNENDRFHNVPLDDISLRDTLRGDYLNYKK